MSCLCTTNITAVQRECGNDLVSGVRKLWVIQDCDVSAVAENANGEVTGLTTVSGATMTSIQVKKATASYTSTHSKGDNGVPLYTTEINFQMPKFSSANRLTYMSLTQADFLVMIELLNGVKLLVGDMKYKCTSNAGTSTSGVALGDKSGYDITISCESTVEPRIVTMDVDTIVDAYGY